MYNNVMEYDTIFHLPIYFCVFNSHNTKIVKIELENLHFPNLE